MVPANADTDISALRFPRLKSEIARREIELLVIKWIVGNVHLAIFAEQFPIGVDDRGGVVIQAGAPLLEERCDDYDLVLACNFAQSNCRFSGNFFGEGEVPVLFRLTKILGAKELRQANDLRALFGGVADERDRPVKILFRLGLASHLHERDFCLFRVGHSGINHEGHEVHEDVNSSASWPSCSSW